MYVSNAPFLHAQANAPFLHAQAVVAAAEGRRTAERHAEALAQRLRVAEAASASAAQQLAEASEART